MFHEHHEKFLKNKFIKTTIIDALFYFVIYLYLSFLSPHLEILGWSESLKGWFFSVFAITGIIVAPIIGTISDKVGRFKMILFGFALEMVSVVGYIFFTSPYVLIPLRIISAIAFNIVVITALSRVNDVLTNNERSKKTSIFHSLLATATMIAPLIGGVIADELGYKAIFMFSAITSFVIIIGILLQDKLFFKQHAPLRKKGKLSLRDGNPFKDVFDVLKIKELRAIGFLGVAINFTAPMTIMILPFIIIEKMGLSNTHLSVAMFVIGAIHMAQFLWSFIAKKVSASKSIIIGLVIFSVCLALMFFTTSYHIFLLLILIKAIGGSLWNINGWTYISNIGEKLGIEGKVVGGYTSLARASQALSFIIVGALLQSFQEGIFIIFALTSIIPLILATKSLIKNDLSKDEVA